MNDCFIYATYTIKLNFQYQMGKKLIMADGVLNTKHEKKNLTPVNQITHT
jgi:hypothetical protein